MAYLFRVGLKPLYHGSIGARWVKMHGKKRTGSGVKVPGNGNGLCCA